MAARGRTPTETQPPAATRVPLHHPELLETKIAAQAAEIKHLVADNRRLGSSHVALREELAAARQEAQRLGAHARSVQAESDVQIRVLADKIARAQAGVRAGEGARSELQQAIKEAQSHVADRHELTARIQDANRELQKARDDIKSLPGLRSELDSLRKEHQRLRSTFEYEKGSNIEQVEELKEIEQKLILMVKEVEKVRIDVLNAEKRASASHPYSATYLNPDFPYPPPMQEKNAVFVDGYTRPLVPVNHQMGFWPSVGERMNPYGSSRVSAAPPNDEAAAAATSADTAVPSSGGTAALASAGASASISGDRSAGEGKFDVADTQGEGDGFVPMIKV